MRFDPELARRILEDLEPITDGRPIWDYSVASVDRTALMYHLRQLKLGGLITGERNNNLGGLGFAPTDLTPAGHSFLAMARDDTAWGKALAVAKGGGTQAVGAVYGALLATVLRGIGLAP